MNDLIKEMRDLANEAIVTAPEGRALLRKGAAEIERLRQTLTQSSERIADAERERDEQKDGWANCFKLAVHHQERADTAEVRLADAVNLLGFFAGSEALSGVRGIVAGWNGENRPDGPFERHPPRLGAQLPKTTCGAVYALDEALQRARALVSSPVTEGDRG